MLKNIIKKRVELNSEAYSSYSYSKGYGPIELLCRKKNYDNH
jgi:hypothetical protein